MAIHKGDMDAYNMPNHIIVFGESLLETVLYTVKLFHNENVSNCIFHRRLGHSNEYSLLKLKRAIPNT